MLPETTVGNPTRAAAPSAIHSGYLAHLTPQAGTCQRNSSAISQTVEQALKIGIAGIGRMGAAIATRLATRGHTLTVWNRTPGKTRALAASGVSVAGSAGELASASDMIITTLTDAAAIDATYHAREGLLSGDVGGKLFIEMSTVRPEVEKALAAKVATRGAALIECPVGGTVGPAKEGKLFGFVGGAVSDVERARPLLDELCRRVEHVGPVGAGASVKLYLPAA